MAAGYTDGFFETGLSPWDIAAGSLLVTEAGGLIGNFTGEADYLYQREVLAGSPKIYAQMVTLLAPLTHVIKEAVGEVAVPAVAASPDATGAFVAAAAAAATAPRKEPVRIRKQDAGRGSDFA